MVISSSAIVADRFRLGFRTGGKLFRSLTDVSTSIAVGEYSVIGSLKGLTVETLGLGVIRTVGGGRSEELYTLCVTWLLMVTCVTGFFLLFVVEVCIGIAESGVGCEGNEDSVVDDPPSTIMVGGGLAYVALG